tara:strand:- start:40399 stop:40839 length:441 start_codon:yes stop_codon:yes gene_type:complete
MKQKWGYILILLLFSAQGVCATANTDKSVRVFAIEGFRTPEQDWNHVSENDLLILDESEIISLLENTSTEQHFRRKKIIAVSLAVTLGVFGVHRLYLGTSTKVPIIYTLTLGGGFGVLVVSDIIAIIATPNLESYSPNSKVFMWAK